MKYIHTTATLFVAMLFLTTLFVSCSSDVEEEEGIITEVEEVVEPEPEPDWADGVITITIGRFKNSRMMFYEMEKKRIYLHDPWTKNDLLKERISMTPLDQQYTIEVTAIPIEEPRPKWVNIAATIEDFKDLGVEPLTAEETMELRLQLGDQPNVLTNHPLSGFYVLPKDPDYIRGICNAKATGIRGIWGWQTVTRKEELDGKESVKTIFKNYYGGKDFYIPISNPLRTSGRFSGEASGPRELRFAGKVRGSKRRVKK